MASLAALHNCGIPAAKERLQIKDRSPFVNLTTAQGLSKQQSLPACNVTCSLRLVTPETVRPDGVGKLPFLHVMVDSSTPHDYNAAWCW